MAYAASIAMRTRLAHIDNSKHQLEPHSCEWFSFLKRKDPALALLTQQTIALAGSPKICSICGTPEQHDYGILNNTSPSHIALTMRLCKRCVRMRTKSIGVRFVRLYREKKPVSRRNGHSRRAAQKPPAPETDIVLQA